VGNSPVEIVVEMLRVPIGTGTLRMIHGRVRSLEEVERQAPAEKREQAPALQIR